MFLKFLDSLCILLIFFLNVYYLFVLNRTLDISVILGGVKRIRLFFFISSIGHGRSYKLIRSAGFAVILRFSIIIISGDGC